MARGTRFRIRGIPRRWKALYLLVVMIRLLVWMVLAVQGLRFLMETGTVEDVILNSLSLGFILEIDTLIYSVSSSGMVKRLMENLEDYDPPSHALHSWSVGAVLREESQERHEVRRGGGARRASRRLLHWLREGLMWLRGTGSIILVYVLYHYYFHAHCCRLRDGSWVSKAVRPPISLWPSPLDYFLNLRSSEEEVLTPSWAWAEEGAGLSKGTSECPSGTTSSDDGAAAPWRTWPDWLWN